MKMGISTINCISSQLLLAFLLVVHLVQGDEIVCQDGWFVGSTGRGSVCLRVGNKTTWDEARRFCLRRHAHLLNLDSAYLLVKQNDLPLSTYLLNNGLNETWLGMEVRYDKLQVDGFPGPSNFSSQLRRQRKLWEWGRGEPGQRGTCGAQLILGAPPPLPTSKEDQSDQNDKSEEQPDSSRVRRQTFTMGKTPSIAFLRDCQESLPFVCVADQIPTAVHLFQNSSVCGDGYGSYLLEQCFELRTEGATYHQAVARCQSRGGNLARSGSEFLRHVTNAVFKQIKDDRDDQGGREIPSNVWVDVDGKECHVIKDSDDVSRPVWPCIAPLPYLCQTPVPLPGPPKPLVRAELPNSQGKGKLTPINARDFTLELTPLFVSRPPANSNNLTCHTHTLVADVQDVTWYKNGQLHAKGVTLILRSETNADYDAVTLVGVYWCEVIDLKTGERSRSNSAFVTMAGIEIYAAEVETFARQGEKLQLTRFSLTGESFPVVERVRNALTAAENSLSPENAPPFKYLPLRVRNESTLEMYAYRFPPGRNPGQSRPDIQLRKAYQAVRKALHQSNADSVLSLDSLQVRSLDFCPGQNIYLPEMGGTVKVEDTPLGGHFILRQRMCQVDGEPLGKVPCQGDKQYGGYWGHVLLNPHCDFDDLNESNVSSTLRDLALLPLDSNNLDHVVSEAVRLTRDPNMLTQLDVIYAADILNNAAKFQRVPPEVARKLMEMSSQVTGVQDDVMKGAQNRGRAANRLLEGLDVLGTRVATPRFQRLQADMATIEVWNISSRDLQSDDVIGLQLRKLRTPSNDSAPSDSIVTLFSQSELDYDVTETAIVLPKDYLRKMYKVIYMADAGVADSNVQIVMHVYADPMLFTASSNSGNNSDKMTLNSKVIAAQLLVNGQRVSDLGNNTVITIFRPFKSTPDAYRAASSRCAYWNFSAEEGEGGWGTEGCSYSRTIDGRDVCQCNHLTNFAILLDLYGQTLVLPEDHRKALSIISTIGLSLSLAGLAATILSFLVFRKLRHGKPQQTLFQLAVALFCTCAVFLAGVTQTQDHSACVAVGALLHYFMLASFLWMLMEAILQYLLFVKVFGIYFPKYILKTSLLAWGVPLIPVITVLSVDYRLYLGGPQYCWLSVPTFYWAFALPVAVILLANLTIYTLVALHICRRSKVATPGPQSDKHQALVNIRASFCCFVVLGLTWVFGYLALEDARLVFQYIFAVTNTTQGLLIFLLFTARDKSVREHWRALCCPRQTRKSNVPRSSSKVSSTSHERLTVSRSGSDQLIDIARIKVRDEPQNNAF